MCQNNILVIIILAIIPIKSAHNPAQSAYRIFLMPTLPKYKVITYKVVSVDPCITDARSPTNESDP